MMGHDEAQGMTLTAGGSSQIKDKTTGSEGVKEPRDQRSLCMLMPSRMR